MISLSLLLVLSSWTAFASGTDSNCYCGDNSVLRKGTPGWTMMFLVKDSSNNFVTKCFSSLISDRHVLTAKDCISKGGKNGTLSLFSDDRPKLEPIEIKRVLGDKTGSSNIAIVEIRNPINFDQQRDFRPICLHLDPKEAMDEGKYWLDYNLPNGLKEIDDYEGTETLSGVKVTRNTHVTISRTNGWRDGGAGIAQCPLRPFTNLYTTKNRAWYATGILHTDHADKYCKQQGAKSVIFERLHPQASGFRKILMEAKTCPPKP